VTRVWLPEPPESIEPLKSLPEGIEADVWTGSETLPESKDEVELIVLPFGAKPAAITEISRLPRLKVIQLMSAGAEHVRPYVPAHITLCNARGAHDTATAEWTVGAIVAHLRKFPRFIRAQEAREWDWVPSETLAGKRVLIVGYGSIGAAVERRLAGWEVTIDRVAKSPRDGVHPIEDLPALLPGADVVVILVPVTDETRHLVNAQFLANMKDNALLVRDRGHRRPAQGAREQQDQGGARRYRPGAAVARSPAVAGARPAAHPARGRLGQRHQRPRLPGDQRPAGPVRRRRAAAERHRCARILAAKASFRTGGSFA